MFETRGKIDEAFFIRNKNHISRYLRNFFVIAISFAVLGVLTFLQGTYFLTYFCGVMLILQCFIWFYMPVLNRKTFIKRMAESGYPDGFTMSSSFGEDCAVLVNDSTGGRSTFAYGAIVRYSECDDGIILFSRQNQYFVFFAGKDETRLREEFLAFLKQKPTKIKWKK